MRILLSNDDGILAPGLAALYDAVESLGEVFVVAPDSPQSAAGHAITLFRPLNVQKVHVETTRSFRGQSVDGRPADCVRLAVKNLVPSPVDLVLSGINAGANVGINVFYSGTVAAAAEAAMLNLPAVAFSASMAGGEVDFRRIARYCRWVLERLLADGLSPGDLVNVNIPTLSPGKPLGVRVAPQSTAGIEDSYVRDTCTDGRESYQLGEKWGYIDSNEETDVMCLSKGYITITPLKVDLTQHGRIASLESLDWNDLPRDDRQ
jgi:5'-nucleotidase